MTGQTKAAKIPDYLWKHITTTTGVDHREVSRNARRYLCKKCRTWTLRGLDADICAIDARVDIVALSPIGEVVALMAGLATWRLSSIGEKWVLDPRDPATIRAIPAGTAPRADVVPGHECGRSWPPTHRAPSNLIVFTVTKFTTDPPF